MDLETRINTLLEDLLYCDFRTSDGIDKAKSYIRNALNIQAIETQAACAEAVLNCPITCADDVGRGGIYPEDAQIACVNIRNV